MHLSIILRKNNGQGSAVAEIVFISSSRVCLTTLCTAGIKGCVSAKMPCMFRDIRYSWQINPLSHPSRTLLFPYFLYECWPFLPCCLQSCFDHERQFFGLIYCAFFFKFPHLFGVGGGRTALLYTVEVTASLSK